ncbi:GT-D fold domain-containing glycosyltransferase [Paenibacillus allorhizosphaerae]|uniref:GT-D fold-like domain-containing protein n=1 Tax=Paenibacillus allorhizosphaerae TaxID=2849866 RepID=A0ABM8VDR8_9BACL|nr:GT-D fold domain-containing glycosyltransferase [Paenibacillus allorhizosphaerae]CAG7628667.1 hypothetical protein PAECIP111802_01482 [Paenibacillus allorhizosphaerae]
MLSSKKRIKIIKAKYGRKPIGAKKVYRLLKRSIRKRRPISVIRLGDVMAKLLARHNIKSLKSVSKFLGIKLPPSRKLLKKIDRSVRSAHIVGLSHYKGSARLIRAYMRKTKWRPPVVTDSFINDRLYEGGYLRRLLRRYRVALVGRAAPEAAERLKGRGYRIPLTVSLDHARELRRAQSVLRRHRKKYDLVFVGGGVPGRILCTRVAKKVRRSAVEIGHMMDAFSHPHAWSKKGDNRKVFKKRWLRKLKKHKR